MSDFDVKYAAIQTSCDMNAATLSQVLQVLADTASLSKTLRSRFFGTAAMSFHPQFDKLNENLELCRAELVKTNGWVEAKKNEFCARDKAGACRFDGNQLPALSPLIS